MTCPFQALMLPKVETWDPKASVRNALFGLVLLLKIPMRVLNFKRPWLHNQRWLEGSGQTGEMFSYCTWWD